MLWRLVEAALAPTFTKAVEGSKTSNATYAAALDQAETP
jgi:hypothetical protein